jgi:uncharacterized RDD family membrane protein YckC
VYCHSCGAVIQEGALACMTCGAPVRDTLAPASTRPGPQLALAEELPGPKCGDHAGMPLLGTCPRCAKPVCVRCAPEAVNDNLQCTSCLQLTVAHQRAPLGAMCAVHPSLAATFTCARCGAFACNHCLPAMRTMDGVCARCVAAVPQGPLASRGSRLGAHLIDSLIIFLFAFVGAITLGIFRQIVHRDMEAVTGLLMFGGVVAGSVIELVAQATWGQSVGKRLLGIKVVRLDGTPIELWRLLVLRNLVLYVVVQLCGVVGLVDALMIFSDDRRCLHDMLADSKVVEVTDT